MKELPMTKNLDMWGWVAFILVLVGGINWGLVGLIDVNIISAILGAGFLGRLVYILVGVGAGYLIYLAFIKKD
jgi:uncharacterized protein